MGSSIRSVEVRALAVVLISALALPSVAWAAKDPKEAEAHAQYDQGLKDYDLGRFKEALDEFSKAYELKALPGFLFNIAQCHRQMHRWERAAFFYRRYLDLSTRRPSNEQVVKDLIAECEQKQTEADAKRAQDAEEARKIELAKAEAQKADSEAAAKREEEARRQREEEQRKAAEQAAAQALAQSALTEPTLVEPLPPPTPVYKKWWFWTAIGVVAVGAAGTTAYFQLTPSPTSLGTIHGGR
jgi:tetratricopeptide (TPR) repeat protein